MPFVIQRPLDGRLLEALELGAQGARSGGAAFAFATTGGIRALLDLPSIFQLAKRNGFQLIVGVDAITNVAALEELGAYQRDLPGLQVHCFYSGDSATFHPKFSWFSASDRTTIITGSGNLTFAGLGHATGRANQRGNWEAFSVDTIYNQAARAEFRSAWRDWLKTSEQFGFLRSLTDADVVQKAISNARVHITNISDDSIATRSADAEQAGTTQAKSDGTTVLPPVFLSEISRNAGLRRWQADLGKQATTKFLGLADDRSKAVVIQRVHDDNSLGVAKTPQIFRVKSDNYRIELDVHDQYTIGNNDSRPIAIFVRLDECAFRYYVSHPSTESHDDLLTLLGPIKDGGRRTMRKAYLDVEDLTSSWKSCPSELVPISIDQPIG